MKHLQVALLTIFTSFATSQAATLSMALRNLDLPNRSAEIDVFVELVAGDTLSTVYFALEDNPDVIHVSNSTNVPNWQAGNTVNLPLGQSQFAVAAELDVFENSLDGPGAFEVGSFELSLPNDLTNFALELAFNTSWPFQLVKENGQFYTFTTNPSYAAYSGYFTFGVGNPGVTQMMDSTPRDTLLITPEPAGLGYLAIAAFALIARRRLD